MRLELQVGFCEKRVLQKGASLLHDGNGQPITAGGVRIWPTQATGTLISSYRNERAGKVTLRNWKCKGRNLVPHSRSVTEQNWHSASMMRAWYRPADGAPCLGCF